MDNLDKNQPLYNKEGKRKGKIIKEIKIDNYILRFREQHDLEENLDPLYRTIGELLYKYASR
ncbi:hypothetical protein ABET51_06820 [Metabacillus fastidiosus]|uniref:hypothetical protein n=1 Tax=Metabacillus fastidiosus TaxID=1458 RepID=UPI003D2E3AA6